MRTVTRARPPSCRDTAVVLAIVLSILLAGCEFLGLDMFPTELQNVEASYDLYGAMRAEGVAGPYRVERVKALVTIGGQTALFAFVSGELDSRLFAFDPDDLSLLKTFPGAGMSRYLGTDNVGSYVCGASQIDASLVVVSSPYGSTPPDAIDFPRSISSIRTENPGSNSALAIYDKDTGSPTLSSSPTPIALGMYFYAIDAETYAGKLHILVRVDSPFRGLLDLQLPYDTPAYVAPLFTGVAPFDTEPSIIMTSVSLDSLDSAWLTADGIIALSHEKETRLTRYAFGSGAEVDSKLVQDDWIEGLSFDPSGDFWYYYDHLSGKLFKLRTWWK